MLNSSSTMIGKKTDYTQEYLFNKIVLPLFKAYPEIAMFAGQTAATNEGIGTSKLDPNSWSYLLMQAGLLVNSEQKHIELERTLQSIVCLHLIAEGSELAYAYWIQKQSWAVLTKDSFDTMHGLCQNYVNTPEIFKAIEASLVYSDLGKSQKIKNLCIQENIISEDHDDLMQALYNSDPFIRKKVIPSFEQLSPQLQQHIIQLNVAIPIHWGYLLQLEGSCKMLEPLLQNELVNPDLLKQNFLINICDIAGALAHIEPLGSKTFNQQAWFGFNMVLDSIEQLLSHRDLSKAYLHLVEQKAKCLGFNHQHLSQENRFILTRLGFFLRFYSENEGDLLQQYADKLWSDYEWELVCQAFGFNTGVNSWQRHPTYMPAVVLNLFNSGSDQKDKYTKALRGFVILAKIIAQSQLLGYDKLKQPISFNNLAAQARANPDLFQQELSIIQINWDDPRNLTIKAPKAYLECKFKI